MCELLLGVSKLRRSQLLERGCKIKLLSWPASNETKNTRILHKLHRVPGFLQESEEIPVT
jgi:hypothetical protein